jgi:hypothetical protein
MLDVVAYPKPCQCISPRAMGPATVSKSLNIVAPTAIALDRSRKGSSGCRVWYELLVTYRSDCDLVMAALAGDLEGHIVWGVAFDLDGAGRQVVEILVQELQK